MRDERNGKMGRDEGRRIRGMMTDEGTNRGEMRGRGEGNEVRKGRGEMRRRERGEEKCGE